ncbi:MAG: tetratricopeptide repeat protein [Flavobacteriales bacterium]
MTYKTYIFIVLTLGSFFSVIAQSERKMTRNGNTNYETGNFIDAEINYKKALEKNSDLLEAQFNLGDALFKQERFDEALEAFEKVSASTEDYNLKANALHNKGNVLLSQQDLEGAIESYKDALRVNPKDHETRYNYTYVKKLLEEQQQQNQDQEKNEDNQEDNKEEDKEQNEEGNDKEDQKNEGSENKDQENSENEDEKQDQQDDGDNNNDETEQDQQDKGQTDGEDSNEENQGEQPKPRENKLSPEEAQRLLDALNQQEEKVQDKMKKHKLKGAKVKIEKDW